MMRVAILLTSALLAAAKHCELDSSKAVTEAIDSALNIWAATERCKVPWVGALDQSALKCEQDVASSIGSVTATIGAIAGMMKDCGAIDEANAQCGLAVNKLISSTAGLAAAGDKLGLFCHYKDYTDVASIVERKTLLGKCTIQFGSAINSIFEAKNTIAHLEKGCENGGKKCAVDVLDVIGVIADLGAHVSGSAAYCQEYKDPAKDVHAEKCTNGVLQAIAELSNVARIAMGVHKKCSPETTRLYLEGHGAASFSGATTMALLAALPLTAVVGVMVGKRIAKSRE